MEEILELLNAGQYTKLRQLIVELNVADIAAYMEEMEKDDLLKLFRILPKNMAADVFSYLEIETEQYIITSLSDRDAAHSCARHANMGYVPPAAHRHKES